MAKKNVGEPTGKGPSATGGDEKKQASAFSRMEAEGGKLLKGVFDFVEKNVPGASKKAREDATRQAQKLFGEWKRAFDEQGKQFQAYEKRLEAALQDLKKNVDEHVRRGFSRLDLATKTDVKELQKAVEKLRKDLNKFVKGSPVGPEGTPTGA